MLKEKEITIINNTLNMEKLIIDRSIWRTGDDSDNATGEGNTALLNHQGYMCCLGMMCEQIGLPRQALLNVPQPHDMDMDIDESYLNNYPALSTLVLLVKITNREGLPEDSYFEGTSFAINAMKINDNETISSEQREEAITMHFATKGITVEFINDYIITNK